MIDAYDGTVRFFMADPDEPILAGLRAHLPGALRADVAPCRPSCRRTCAIPEDLFIAQNQSYRLYHLPATEAAPPPSTTRTTAGPSPTTWPAGGGQPMEPYYVIMRMPGEDSAEFVLIQPLVPEQRPNMIAWVAARMDPGVYGERIAFRFPTDTSTEGPAQIESRIDQDDAISAQFSALGSVRLVGDPRQPAGAAHRRGRAALRGADLPAGDGRAVPASSCG